MGLNLSNFVINVWWKTFVTNSTRNVPLGWRYIDCTQRVNCIVRL